MVQFPWFYPQGVPLLSRRGVRARSSGRRNLRRVRAPVAQGRERLPSKQRVGGSNPSGRAN